MHQLTCSVSSNNIVTFFQKLIAKLQEKFSSQFIRNLSWLGMGEIIYRIVRLGATVVIARYLSERDYGLGAIVLTVNEYTRTFTDVGITPKLIQAEEKDIERLCNAAYWLNWAIFGGLFIIQCIAAFPVSYIYRSPELALPICVAGIPYLIWPLIAIQFTLIQRENRLKVIAISNTLRNSLGSISSAGFAFLGWGVWAFVLPTFVSDAITLYIYFKNHSWRPTTKFSTKYWGELFSFGRNILGISLFKTLRNNLDYLIVGSLISVEQLGIYFFGFNAGLGISLSIINAINSAILPHLCAVRSQWIEFKTTYFKSLRTISFIIVPFVCFQSSMAPLYVPIVFGEKWRSAIPILILICLSAIPRAFADAASQLLVAVGRPDLDLRWNVIFTILFSAALLIGVRWQAIGVATSVSIIHFVCLPLFTLWATRYVFSKKESLHLDS